MKLTLADVNSIHTISAPSSLTDAELSEAFDASTVLDTQQYRSRVQNAPDDWSDDLLRDLRFNTASPLCVEGLNILSVRFVGTYASHYTLAAIEIDAKDARTLLGDRDTLDYFLNLIVGDHDISVDGFALVRAGDVPVFPAYDRQKDVLPSR